MCELSIVDAEFFVSSHPAVGRLWRYANVLSSRESADRYFDLGCAIDLLQAAPDLPAGLVGDDLRLVLDGSGRVAQADELDGTADAATATIPADVVKDLVAAMSLPSADTSSVFFNEQDDPDDEDVEDLPIASVLYALSPLTTSRELLITHLVKDHKMRAPTTGRDLAELHASHLALHGVPIETVPRRDERLPAESKHLDIPDEAFTLWRLLVELAPRHEAAMLGTYFAALTEMLSQLLSDDRDEVSGLLASASSDQDISQISEILNIAKAELLPMQPSLASAATSIAELDRSNRDDGWVIAMNGAASEVSLALSYADRTFAVLYDRGVVDADWILTSESMNGAADDLMQYAYERLSAIHRD